MHFCEIWRHQYYLNYFEVLISFLPTLYTRHGHLRMHRYVRYVATCDESLVFHRCADSQVARNTVTVTHVHVPTRTRTRWHTHAHARSSLLSRVTRKSDNARWNAVNYRRRNGADGKVLRWSR